MEIKKWAREWAWKFIHQIQSVFEKKKVLLSSQHRRGFLSSSAFAMLYAKKDCVLDLVAHSGKKELLGIFFGFYVK